MGKTLKEKMAKLPEDRLQRIQAETDELIADEMSLRELRKNMDMTQARVAEFLGIGQDEVSRVERRADMLVSTLRNLIKAMGGELEITARFPDKRDVRIARLGDVLEDEEDQRALA